MADTMRVFIALQPPAELRQRIFDGFAGVRAAYPRGRWVPADNIHATVKFLGEADRRQVEGVANALARLVAARTAYRVDVSGAGSFPGGPRARVLWAGLASGQGPTADLAREVDLATVQLGFPAERRPFQSHLTVARIGPEGVPPAALEELEQLRGKAWGYFIAGELVLMQSILRPQGPLYRPLGRFALAAPGPSCA